MHPETIDGRTKRILIKIDKIPFLRRFYLAGGTALALQKGHRKSIDLDFFSSRDFTVSEVKHVLENVGEMTVVGEAEQTLHCVLDGVNLSLLHYKYRMLFDLLDFKGIKLADERDIGAMKIDAVSARGSRKDFIDLYVLLLHHSLEELIGFFEKKYAGINYNRLHILKSLTFFEDAETEPSPNLLIDIAWDDVKQTIIQKVLELER